ncbi:AfsR/SARP family transcriptional regulator, partial [Streptomyces sp. TRM76130]|nr:AfsR/SARP family transcriptional regulator [Streptomyces sp. TRM76130]
MLRAMSLVLRAFPEMRPPHYERLTELCAADAPLLACLASGTASYLWQTRGEPERALEYARRMLDALGPLENPAVRMLCHGRISDLCLRGERGEEAYVHLRAALDAFGGTGDWTDLIGVGWGLVLACLQRG